MPYPQGFQKAKLKFGSDTVECGFNPQDYTISKTNLWTYKPNQGEDTPKPEFGGGMPMTYKLSLLLDASLQGPDKSIKDDANKLMAAMHGNHSAPQFIEFSWGSVTLPKAAPVSISIRYALFRPNGEPVRAFVDLELAQAEETSPPGEGTEPDHSGDHRASGTHGSRRRLVAVDRLPRLRRRDAVAPDRGGKRHRQPTALAPRQ